MCYKISVTSDPEVLEDRFDAKFRPEYEHKIYYHANGFSYPALPVITQKYPKEIIPFNWALIPSWVKDTEQAKKLKTGNLNAMCETVFDKPTWRGSIKNKRCLVLADAFYESMDVNGVKFPHLIYRKDKQPFAFAGLYNVWKDEADKVHQTFAILTTEPNELMARIHNIKKRMPVILPPELERRWIEPDLMDDEIKNLMMPLEDGILAAHPVSKLVNQNKLPNNEPSILEVQEYPELA